MQVGDIVECVDDSGVQEWVRVGKHYTVRGHLPYGTLFQDGLIWRSADKSGGLFLEEVRVNLYGYDHPFRTSRFRKVEPMSLSELLEVKEEEYA